MDHFWELRGGNPSIIVVHCVYVCVGHESVVDFLVDKGEVSINPQDR